MDYLGTSEMKTAPMAYLTKPSIMQIQLLKPVMHPGLVVFGFPQLPPTRQAPAQIKTKNHNGRIHEKEILSYQVFIWCQECQSN